MSKGWEGDMSYELSSFAGAGLTHTAGADLKIRAAEVVELVILACYSKLRLLGSDLCHATADKVRDELTEPPKHLNS